ncbi:high mobility group, partial [Desmophyllum pertusum]
KVPASMEYITDLLYNGFYCFEALTERNLDNTIYWKCGILGEVYFGDGNEKNCCSRNSTEV